MARYKRGFSLLLLFLLLTFGSASAQEHQELFVTKDWPSYQKGVPVTVLGQPYKSLTPILIYLVEETPYTYPDVQSAAKVFGHHYLERKQQVKLLGEKHVTLGVLPAYLSRYRYYDGKDHVIVTQVVALEGPLLRVVTLLCSSSQMQELTPKMDSWVETLTF